MLAGAALTVEFARLTGPGVTAMPGRPEVTVPPLIAAVMMRGVPAKMPVKVVA